METDAGADDACREAAVYPKTAYRRAATSVGGRRHRSLYCGRHDRIPRTADVHALGAVRGATEPRASIRSAPTRADRPARFRIGPCRRRAQRVGRRPARHVCRGRPGRAWRAVVAAHRAQGRRPGPIHRRHPDAADRLCRSQARAEWLSPHRERRRLCRPLDAPGWRQRGRRLRQHAEPRPEGDDRVDGYTITLPLAPGAKRLFFGVLAPAADASGQTIFVCSWTANRSRACLGSSQSARYWISTRSSTPARESY